MHTTGLFASSLILLLVKRQATVQTRGLPDAERYVGAIRLLTTKHINDFPRHFVFQR